MGALDFFYLLVGGLAVTSFSLWHFRSWSTTQHRCLDLVYGSPVFWSTPGTYRRFCVYYALAALGAFLILVAIFSAVSFQTILAIPAAFVTIFLFLTVPELARQIDSFRGYLQRHAFQPPLPSGKELRLLDQSGYGPSAIMSMQQAIPTAPVDRAQTPTRADRLSSPQLSARELVNQLHRISNPGKKSEIESLLRPVLKEEPFRVIPVPPTASQPGNEREEALLQFLLCLAVVRFIHYAHVPRTQRISEVRHFLHPRLGPRQYQPRP
jgi:hypothetical protein